MALTSCVVCNVSDPELPSSGESHKLRKLLSEILNLVVEDNDASIMICKKCNIALVAAHEYYRLVTMEMTFTVSEKDRCHSLSHS